MDINLANRLSVLIIGLVLAATPAGARVTLEAFTADSVQIYSGDSLPASPTIGITLNTSLNLTTEASAITLKADGVSNNLTPSTRTAGTITASHSPAFTDGNTHSLLLTVKETNGDATTFEVNNLSVDNSGALVALGDPLNFPNPCNSDTGTAIGYKLSKPADITISIHDLMGNLIWKNTYPSGTAGGRATYNEITWDCKTQSGQTLGNGIYVYLIIGEGKLLSKGRIAIIK